MADYTFAITGSDLSGPAWKAFVDNVKKANDQVAALGKSDGMDKLASGIDGIKSRIEGLVSGAKALAGLWAVDKIRSYADGLQAAGARIADLAEKTGFTTEQVQALQRAARLSGEDFDKLAAAAQTNRDWLDRLVESARRANTILGDNTVKALDEAAKASERAKREAGDLGDNFDRLAGPSIVWGLQQLSMGFKSMAESLDLIRVHGGAALPTIRELANLLTGGQASRIAGESADSRSESYLQTLESNVVGARRARETEMGRFHPAEQRQALQRYHDNEVAKAEADLAAAQRAEIQRRARNQTTQQERDQRLFNRPIDVEIAEWARYGQRPSGLGGGAGAGGGADKRDRIGENLIQFTAQADAAKTALEALQKAGQNPFIPLDDLERQVKLEKEIADATAAAGKYARDDPRIPQLEQQIRKREEAEAGIAKLTNAYKLADTTERQYGDGLAVRLQTEAQLKDALDTRRLSVDAYKLAIQELGKSTEDLRLKNLGLQGGLTGFGAGWQNAQNQFERANNAFAMGGAFYNQMMNTMTLATQSWGQSFDQILLNAGASWARFLATMAMQAAASSVWSVAGPALGSIVSGIAGAFFGGYSGTAGATELYGSASSTMGSLSFGGPRAGGGPVMAGQGYIVGENGPEWFQPTSGGNILNNQQLAALGVGGGGGGDIHVHLGGVTMGRGVSHAEMRAAVRQMGEQVYQAAQRAMIDQRRRGVPSVKGAFG